MDRATPLPLGWNPDTEREFQQFWTMNPHVRQWRNSFANVYGEPPQLNDAGYNYRTAFQGGPNEWPRSINGDMVQHWGSLGKAPDHPTEWKARFVEQFGVDPDAQAQAGFSGPMQQFMRGPIAAAPFSLMPRIQMGGR